MRLRTVGVMTAVAAVVVTITTSAGAGVGGSSGKGPRDTGANGDPVIAAVATPPILAPADLVVDESAGIVNLVVRLAEEGENTVTVNYSTFNSSAGSANACNGDYVGHSGTLTFTPGDTAETVPVQILECGDVEAFEAFTLGLATAVNGTIARASTRISIVDNDTVVATPRLFVRDAIVDERDGSALVSVLLGGPAGQASNSTVTVDYTTASGTAIAGSDFTSMTGTLTFAAGETAKTVVVPIAPDPDDEPTERFALALSNPINATISDSTGTVVIGASDGAASSSPFLSATPDLVVGEADGFVDLVVSLSEPGQEPVTVNYSTFNASAGSANACNGDYVGHSGTLTFAPGETTKFVRVQILECANEEGLEAFTLGLATPANASIARASGRVLIVDNDTIAATPRLFVRDAIVDEKDGSALVSVLLGSPAGQASNSTVTVDFATSNGTASAGSDYTGSTGTLTFAPGETAKTVVVAIADDGTVEPAENFTLDLSGAAGATISDDTAVVVIGRSDAAASTLPQISATPDLVLGEADGYVDLTVGLSVPAAEPVSVNFSTFNSSAGSANACNGDYLGFSGTIVFAPGETTKAVRVQIFDCDDLEAFEAFTLGLATPDNAIIARASGRIAIVDNDNVVATPRLFVRDAVVDEKDGSALVSVLLGGPAGQASNGTVTVDYQTSNGTASAGSDYTAAAGTLTFAPGETAKTVVVAIADDGLTEPTEDFALGLSNATGTTIADGSAVVVIGASDAAASSLPSLLAPVDAVVGEREGFVDLIVRLSAPSDDTVSVNYSTFNSTAGSANACNGDYVGHSGTLTFAPGETTKVIRLQILECADNEGLEAFTLGLATPDNASIARASGRIAIVDNDTIVATPSLVVRDAVVDEKDGKALVSVLLGGPAGQASNGTVTVDVATSNGTASAGSDYTAAAGTLTFAPGETAKTVVVAITDDGATEPAESLTLGLSNASGATIADGSGTVVIGASDAAASALPGIFATADVVVNEGDGFVDLVVNLSEPGLQPVSVNYSTFNITAGSANACNGDYVGHSGTITFAPGETTKVVRVQILDCPDVESLETFRFGIATPVNGIIARANGQISIVDNEGPRTLMSIAVTPANPSITVGTDRQFTAIGTYSDASTADITGSVTWASASAPVATIGAGGLAHAVNLGTTTISATLGAISGSTLLTVGLNAQSISFTALANKTYGDPDLTVSATASSGLPVSFTAGGNCTVSGATVHITGAGSCTITASQPGNTSYAPAPSVSRTFAIAKASQTITFLPLANKKLGDPDFTVRASASSGLAVSFAAFGKCTVSGARVHLTAVGSCTITASQAGNANHNAAPAVSRTFSITRKLKCKVPRVISKQLAAARSMINRGHCLTGKVTRVYSRARRKGVVIGQSRRPGQVLPANSKINLVVSRGRRR